MARSGSMKNINDFPWPPVTNFPDNHKLHPLQSHCKIPTHTYNSAFSGRRRRKMEESWRMRMGTTVTKQSNNNLPPRRSTEETTSSSRQNVFRGYETLDPEDFDDVFGGPPRSVLSRQYSVEGDFARSTMYEDVFRKPKDYTDLGGRSDRTLPEFRIPASRTGGGRRSEEEFYSDIFGSLRRSRSRSKSQTNSNSKSKSNSSSILSSEELSPLRPPAGDDDDVFFSSFASKLRPINVSSKWNNTSQKTQMEEEQPVDSPCKCHSFPKNQDAHNDYIYKFKDYHSGLSQRVSSPEILSFGPNSYSSIKESIEDLQLNSPSSIVSSLCTHDQEDIIDQEEDEIMSSYVIEINPEKRERIGEAIGIDDAIAWAKQNCQTCNVEKDWKELHKSPGVEEMAGLNKFPEVQIARLGSKESPSLEKLKEWTSEDPVQLEKDMELELLDEDIKLWSDGKEPNIRLLLSTLHHILWPSSGWNMIPLSSLKESSNVKKAYQKARLYLHPDKLQQRGATTPQKYVAEKAFPILQDAWGVFISQDVRSSIT